MDVRLLLLRVFDRDQEHGLAGSDRSKPYCSTQTLACQPRSGKHQHPVGSRSQAASLLRLTTCGSAIGLSQAVGSKPRKAPSFNRVPNGPRVESRSPPRGPLGTRLNEPGTTAIAANRNRPVKDLFEGSSWRIR
jgi:hypothetical protein